MSRYLACVLLLWLVSISISHDVCASRIRSLHRDLDTHVTHLTTEALMEQTAMELQQQMMEHVVQNAANGQVGIEVELQTAPRIVVMAKAGAIATMKDDVRAAVHPHAAGKFYKAGRTWLDVAVVPQLYSDAWLSAENGAWYLSTDNEKHPPSDASKDFWKTYVAKWFGEDEAYALRRMGEYTGLHACMEIVTKPLDTDSVPGDHPTRNVAYTIMALRTWVQTLRSFMRKTAEGGRVADRHLALSLTDDQRDMIAHANGGPIADTSKIALVTVSEVMNAFKSDLQAIEGEWNGISGYHLKTKNYPSFQVNKHSPYPGGQSQYERYFLFPVTGAFNDDQLQAKFGFGPQLNFGFPVVNFASSNKARSMKVVQTPKFWTAERRGKRSFTARIWANLQDVAIIRLFGPAKSAYQAQYGGPPTVRGIEDAKGFFVLWMYYYFIKSYLGMGDDKFAHAVLIKAAINDVLRAFEPSAKRIVASWWDSLKIDGVLAVMDDACGRLWLRSDLKGQRYPDPAGNDIDKKKTITNVLAPVNTNNGASVRWQNEHEGTALAPSVYGKLNTGADDDNQYPTDRDGETPVGKPIPPFKIKGRVAVLLEHRDGDNLSSRWSLKIASNDACCTTKAKMQEWLEKPGTRMIAEMKKLQDPNLALIQVGGWPDDDGEQDRAPVGTKLRLTNKKPILTEAYDEDVDESAIAKLEDKKGQELEITKDDPDRIKNSANLDIKLKAAADAANLYAGQARAKLCSKDGWKGLAEEMLKNKEVANSNEAEATAKAIQHATCEQEAS